MAGGEMLNGLPHIRRRVVGGFFLLFPHLALPFSGLRSPLPALATFTYDGLQLVVSLPIYWSLLPRSTGYASKPKSHATETTEPANKSQSKENRRTRFVLVAAAVTLSAIIQSTMAIHLLTILQAQGVKMAAAVTLGTLVGPRQVLARVLANAHAVGARGCSFSAMRSRRLAHWYSSDLSIWTAAARSFVTLHSAALASKASITRRQTRICGIRT
jgi:hypothetical protein